MRIFLDSGIHNFSNRPVMPEMNDLAALILQNTPNDTDRRVVAIEERGCRDETQRGSDAATTGSALWIEWSVIPQ